MLEKGGGGLPLKSFPRGGYLVEIVPSKHPYLPVTHRHLEICCSAYHQLLLAACTAHAQHMQCAGEEPGYNPTWTWTNGVACKPYAAPPIYRKPIKIPLGRVRLDLCNALGTWHRVCFSAVGSVHLRRPFTSQKIRCES